GLGHGRWYFRLRVLFQVGRPEQDRAGLKKQHHVTVQMNRAGEITARRETHLTAAHFRARLDGSVYERRIKRDAISPCAVLAHAETVNTRARLGGGGGFLRGLDRPGKPCQKSQARGSRPERPIWMHSSEGLKNGSRRQRFSQTLTTIFRSDK